jgi:hypothetical protein
MKKNVCVKVSLKGFEVKGDLRVNAGAQIKGMIEGAVKGGLDAVDAKEHIFDNKKEETSIGKITGDANANARADAGLEANADIRGEFSCKIDSIDVEVSALEKDKKKKDKKKDKKKNKKDKKHSKK